MRFAKSQSVELGSIVNLVVVVGLVGDENNGELCAAQNCCHILVPVGQSSLYIDEEEHEVGLFCSHDYLLADGIFEDVIALNHPSTGVYNRKLASVPLAFAILAVACSAGCVANDSLTCLGQAVEQCRLAHIGASHYCH